MLKEVAPLSILPVLVTDETAQSLMSELKELPLNMFDTSVTNATFHDEISMFKPEQEMAVGLFVGLALGLPDGSLDGLAVGLLDGNLDGLAVGLFDGALDGVAVGLSDGAFDGLAVGLNVGALEGLTDGLFVC